MKAPFHQEHAACYACGGVVRSVAEAGRTAGYREYSDVAIPETLALPTCDNCGEMWLDDALCHALDAALAGELDRRRLADALFEKAAADVIDEHLELLERLAKR
jgi:hypothetical protein